MEKLFKMGESEVFGMADRAEAEVTRKPTNTNDILPRRQPLEETNEKGE